MGFLGIVNVVVISHTSEKSQGLISNGIHLVDTCNVICYWHVSHRKENPRDFFIMIFILSFYRAN